MTLNRFQHLRRVALAALIVSAFILLLIVRSAWSYAAEELIEAAGLGLILVGILGRIWCTLYIGGRKSAEIVDTGPYSTTRNPLYVFSSIAAAGVGAQTGSLVLAALFFAGSVLAFHLVIRREETHLQGLFGASYDAYRARVPRFWPNPFLFIDQSRVDVPTRRIYATLADGLVFLVAKPAFELVEYAQAAGLIRIALRLY